MRTLRFSHPQWMHDSVSDHLACPSCHGPLHRRRRTAWDRLVSSAVPVRRYTCESCAWTGLRRRPDTPEDPSIAPPPSFILHMAVVAVGVVLMLGLLLLDVIPGIGQSLMRSLGLGGS